MGLTSPYRVIEVLGPAAGAAAAAAPAAQSVYFLSPLPLRLSIDFLLQNTLLVVRNSNRY